MPEAQALVERAVKLIHEYEREPIDKSPSPRTPRRGPKGAVGPSAHGEAELAKAARRAVAEPAREAGRAVAELARAENPTSCRHDRKCSVCRHRDREEIEREFLHWHSPEKIAEEYGIAHHSSIYRHAHATGLFAQRATNLRIALSPIIEQAMLVPATADNVIRAVIAFAHLNDQGQWVEPPKTFIHHRAEPAACEADAV